jgi:formyl-CoA transferase
VHTSLLEALITLLDFQAARWLIAKEVPGQAGNNHPTMVPAGPYKTSDGLINIAATGGVIYERFCQAAGLEYLLNDPEYSTLKARQQNRDKLNGIIEETIKTKPSKEWIDLLNEAGVPCGPIYKIDEMFADPQVKHTGMAAPVYSKQHGRDIEVVGQGIHMSRTPWKLRSATPERGEHTDEVLHELGFDDAKISELRKAAIV